MEVPLVVTVADDPKETQWFGERRARPRRSTACTVMTPGRRQHSGSGVRGRRSCSPDFIFSFYYRSLLKAPILDAARRGALNMHGSLLPKYRGRAPVNWAILRGESETGATLHYMVDRADAGDIVDQLAVPILGDDDAREVFAKVTAAAEIVLARSLPRAARRHARRALPQPIEPGQYFGRRRPEDGRIDWSWPAAGDPQPRARGGAAVSRARSRTVERGALVDPPHRIAARTVARRGRRAQLFGEDGKCYAACRDGGVLRAHRPLRRTPARSTCSLGAELRKQPWHWLSRAAS